MKAKIHLTQPAIQLSYHILFEAEPEEINDNLVDGGNDMEMQEVQ